jgi:hypothetical protein
LVTQHLKANFSIFFIRTTIIEKLFLIKKKSNVRNMKLLKKTTISFVLIFSMVSIMSVSTLAAGVTTPKRTVTETLGHSFEEDSWAIEYDVLSGKLIKDLTPGPNSSDYKDLAQDPSPFRDSKFYAAYINTGQVQTFYMALMNYTFDNRNVSNQGVAPFQVLLQHYRAPGGNHVIIQNSFAGLVAYQENGTVNGVPDKNDTMYYGYTLNSEMHKHMINRYLSTEIGYSPFNQNLIPKVTPLPLSNTTTGDLIEYTFGMSYENLFVLWHQIDRSDDMNTTTKAVNVLDKIVAISSLDSINFTYKLTGTVVEDKAVNITTTTEYDIGKTSDLWILNDNKNYSEAIGGKFYNLTHSPTRTVSRYNTTTAVANRLAGNINLTGFGLGISNFARITVLSGNKSAQNDTQVIDNAGGLVDGERANYNVTKLDIRAGQKPAFLIDFASKPNYTLNNGTPMAAPVKLYPNLQVKSPVLHHLDELAQRYLKPMVTQAISVRLQKTKEKLDVKESDITIDVKKRHLFYTICFPKWEGKQINQDPTFVAFTEPVDFTSITSDARGIDGYALATIMLGGLGAVALTLIGIKKRRKFLT